MQLTIYLGEMMVGNDSTILVATDKRGKESNELPAYKARFIDVLMNSGALKVGGEFLLKNMTVSPYFVDVGEIHSGRLTLELADAYAGTIAEHLRGKFNVLYGIPDKCTGLERTVSTSLFRNYGIDSDWFFTRKTPKTHGEATNLPPEELAKRMIVGKVPIRDDGIVLLDDVFTTGNTKYDELEKLGRLLGRPKITAIVVAVDRQEAYMDGKSAMERFTEDTGIPVYAILKATDIIQHLSSKVELNDERLRKMLSHLMRSGTEEAKAFLKRY
jgi:orotate phosphoribosyltransferase